MPSVYENLRTGKREPLFQHPTDGTELSDFSAILKTVSKIPIITDAQGAKLLRMPTFQHNGRPESIVVTARTLNIGKPDKPRMLFLPPYPFPARLSKVLFGSREFKDWEQEGISPFEADDTMPAPYRSAQGAIYAYAGGMRMLHERIKDAHDKGQKVGVVGFSYGANVTSAYLAYINTLPPDERARSLPDSIFAIEGGNILESILHSKFGKRGDPKSIDKINSNNSILPSQTRLSPDIASNTLAVINNEDLVVPGQSTTWQGARKYEVRGTHVRAPLYRVLQIRKLLSSHFQQLLK